MPDTDDLREELKGLTERLEKDPEDLEEVQKLVIDGEPRFELRVSELLAACDKHPDHPNAKVFRKAVRSYSPEKNVVVDRVDLEALLHNNTVKTSLTTHRIGDDLHPMRKKAEGGKFTKKSAGEMEESEASSLRAASEAGGSKTGVGTTTRKPK